MSAAIAVIISCLRHLAVVWLIGIPFWIAFGFIGLVGSILAPVLAYGNWRHVP